ncbi:MAG: hypothetical protein U1E51_18285 [Candidatus Binatia bacterium]|nr:hypothetical protein [Candidatus Binatia bacterium]
MASIIEPPWFDFEHAFTKFLQKGVTTEWLDSLDWLSQRNYDFVYSEEALWVEDLIHHFVLNPEKRKGLLSILAAAAPAVGSRIPRDVLKTIKSWNKKAAYDAMTLTLARNDLTKEELVELATEIKSADFNVEPWRLFHVASKASARQAAGFAITVLDLMSLEPEQAVRVDQAARRCLIDYLNKRPSNLGSSDVWNKLDLPQRV